MEIEEIRQLKVTLPFCEVRAGKALTTIELMHNGKLCGRDLVLRTETEVHELIEALLKVEEYFK